MEQVQRGGMGLLVPAGILVGVAAVMGGWLTALVFAVEAGVLLAIGWLAARAEARDPVWTIRRCLECGRPVPATATICRDEDCDGTLFGTQAQYLRRSQLIQQAADAHRDPEAQLASRDWKGAPTWSWFPSAGRRWLGWWGSIAFAPVLDPDPRDPVSMRWWASGYFIAGAVLGWYGTAAWLSAGFLPYAYPFIARHPFLAALPVPVIMLAGAYAASRWGPRSMVERAEPIELPVPIVPAPQPHRRTVPLSVYVREIIVHDNSEPGPQNGEFDIAVTVAACPAAAVRRAQTIASVRWTGSVANGHAYPVERWLEPVDVQEEGGWLSITAGGVEHDLLFDDTIYGGVTVLGAEVDWGRGCWWKTVNGKHFDLVFCVSSDKSAPLPSMAEALQAPGSRSSSMPRRAVVSPAFQG